MRAFVVGGSGVVGAAISRRLVAAGWSIDVVGRDPAHLPPDLDAAGVRHLAADRADAAAMRSAFGGGADLLVDCICYTAEQAAQLLPLAADSGATVMISSKAVYADAAGRHSNSDEPPRFDGPIRESQPTVAPGRMDFNSRDGYGRNKVAAELEFLGSGLPVTVLRPSKVYGEGARPPREWVFVKRVLDGRATVLLARQGRGVDHPSAASNIAALVETVAAKPGRRILNSADPDAPCAREIARAVARHLDHEWDEVLLDDSADRSLGRHPWDRVPPIVLDMGAAADLGYSPVGDYPATLGAEIDWLVATAVRTDQVSLPEGYDDEDFDGLFDYAQEDRFLAGR